MHQCRFLLSRDRHLGRTSKTKSATYCLTWTIFAAQWSSKRCGGGGKRDQRQRTSQGEKGGRQRGLGRCGERKVAFIKRTRLAKVLGVGGFACVVACEDRIRMMGYFMHKRRGTISAPAKPSQGKFCRTRPSHSLAAPCRGRPRGVGHGGAWEGMVWHDVAWYGSLLRPGGCLIPQPPPPQGK